MIPYVLLLVIQSVTGAPTEQWIINSEPLTKDQCEQAIQHLPPEQRPLSLAIDAANTTQAPRISFACVEEDPE